MPRGHQAAQRGYANEMKAGAWLIENGYEVFMGVGNTSCDLMVLKDGQAIRVEVKTLGMPNGLGRYWVQCNQDLFDMLVVITPEGAVVVDPPEALVGRTRGHRTLAEHRRSNGRSGV